MNGFELQGIRKQRTDSCGPERDRQADRHHGRLLVLAGTRHLHDHPPRRSAHRRTTRRGHACERTSHQPRPSSFLPSTSSSTRQRTTRREPGNSVSSASVIAFASPTISLGQERHRNHRRTSRKSHRVGRITGWKPDITGISELDTNTVYWVWFDEPQLDAEGDGPYRADMIWESALIPL